MKMGAALTCTWLGTLMIGYLSPGNGALVAARNPTPVPTVTRDVEKAFELGADEFQEAWDYVCGARQNPRLITRLRVHGRVVRPR